MPGKHVHFAYDQYPPTPPSSYSHTSSLPSPGGPITPPPLQYFGSPHACLPLPSVSSQINPVLGMTCALHLHYSLALPPSTLQLHPSVPRHVLGEAATYPPLPHMTIISRHLYESWAIVVKPSGKSAFVTVSDVIDAIYHSLRQNVIPEEFQKLPSDAQRRVNDTYKRRYTMISDPRAYKEEKSKGLKRIDFLAEKNTFAGLSIKRGPDVWELNVS